MQGKFIAVKHSVAVAGNPVAKYYHCGRRCESAVFGKGVPVAEHEVVGCFAKGCVGALVVAAEVDQRLLGGVEFRGAVVGEVARRGTPPVGESYCPARMDSGI